MKRIHLCRCVYSFLLLGFLLGVKNGRIALWKDGQATPMKVFPYPVAALPAQTQQQLATGIRVDSMEDLDRLLEILLS
jgi:hypothetical protein